MEETDRTENTKITEEMLGRFQRYLKEEEKSVPTIQKYMREARNFARFLKGGDIEKEKVIAYRFEEELYPSVYGFDTPIPAHHLAQ